MTSQAENKFDFIIIGSGLSGLASALILAKEGKKVCILEKNQQLGGNLQTFSRNKRIFDTGVHYLGGLSEGQNLYQLFDYLDIAKDLQLQKMDEDGYDKISFDDDEIEYPHAQGYENFENQLTKIFPDEAGNIKKYTAKIKEICASFPAYQLDFSGKYSEEVLYENVWDFINSVTQNEKLRSVLLGTNFLYAANKKTPLYVHALTVNSYIESAFRCVKGGSQITKLLVKELRKHGAEIHKKTEVAHFNFEENKLVSVSTKNEKIFSAENFISAVDIKVLIKFLNGKKCFPKSFTERISSLKPVSSCFSVYVVLKKQSVPYFNYNHYHFKSLDSIWKNTDYEKENWPENYMISCVEDLHYPGFAESFTVISYFDFDEVKSWENSFNTVAEPHERADEYENFKQKKAEILLEEIFKKFPDFRGNIEAVYTSSPLSYRDYIGVEDGSMYGYQKDSGNPFQTMFSPRTKVPNLYLTGQSVAMHGILGVTISAFNTCAEILGRDYFNSKLKDEKI